MQRRLIVVSTVLLFFGCSSAGISTKEAEREVTVFHRQLEDKDFPGIYQRAEQQFRDAAKQEDFAALGEAINRKLGKVKVPLWPIGV